MVTTRSKTKAVIKEDKKPIIKEEKKPIIKTEKDTAKSVKEEDITWIVIEKDTLDKEKFKGIHTQFYNAKGSIPTLYKLIKDNEDIDKKEITKWYNQQEIVQIMKRPPNKARSVYRHYDQSNVLHTIEVDLLFMPLDNGYKYIFTAVDIASRYKWAYPIKTKKSLEILTHFKKLYNSLKKRKTLIKQVSADDGSEFKSSFKEFLEDKKIRKYEAEPSNHLAMVENFNGMLSKRLFLPLQIEELESGKDVSIGWVKRLPIVVEELNDTFNYAIELRPKEAFKKSTVKQREGNFTKQDAKKVHKLGTKVRRLLNKDEVEHLPTGKIRVERKRLTDPNYSKKIYYVQSVYFNGIYYHRISEDLTDTKMRKNQYTYFQLQAID